MTPAPATPGTVHCHWIHDLSGLAGLGPAWDALASESAPDSAFHRHAWAMAWAESFAPESLAILVLRAGSAPGSVRAIVPWVRWPARLLGLPVRRYTLLGGLPTGTTKRSRAAAWLARDLRWGWGAVTPWLVAAHDRRELLAIALRETARALHPDLLQIAGLAEQEPIDAAPFASLATSHEPNWSCPTGGESTGPRRLSKRTRKRFATALEALRALPGFTWSVHAGREIDAREIDEIAALEARSTKSAGGRSILTSGAANRAFFARLLQLYEPCWVGRMRANGKLIAYAVGLAAGARGEGILLAHDPEHDERYAGALGYLLVEEHLAAQGATSWSLGRGEDFWKTERFLGTAEPLVDVALYGATARGRLLHLAHRWVHGRVHRRKDRERTRTPAAAHEASVDTTVS